MKSVKHMKKILLYILAASTLTMTRCSNFLEVEQLGKSDIPNYLSDIDGIRTAANGIYRTAYDFYDKYFMRYADVASDLVSLTISATDQTLQNLYNFSSMKEDNTGYPRYLWLSGYTILTNANNLLEYLPAAKEKYVEIAKACGVYKDGMDVDAAVDAACKAIEDLSKLVGIPQHLTELGITEQDIPALAEQAIADVCTPGNPREVTKEDIIGLYKQIL